MEWEYQKMYIVLRNVNRNELSVPNPRCNGWFTITMACEPKVTRIRSWKKLQIVSPLLLYPRDILWTVNSSTGHAANVVVVNREKENVSTPPLTDIQPIRDIKKISWARPLCKEIRSWAVWWIKKI